MPDAALGVKSVTATGTDRNLRLQNALGVPFVIVVNSGYVGFGTATPTRFVDILSAVPGVIKIRNGNGGAGKMFTSDANGQATWERPKANVILDVWGAGGNVLA